MMGRTTVPVRRVTSTDLPFILSFCRELNPRVDAEATQVIFGDLLQDENTGLFIAEIDGAPGGFIEIHLLKSLQSGRHGLIRSLFVSMDFRRRGVARQLVWAAETWAFTRGGKKVIVQSKIERDTAKEFYLNEGYSIAKVQNVFQKSGDFRQKMT